MSRFVMEEEIPREQVEFPYGELEAWNLGVVIVRQKMKPSKEEPCFDTHDEWKLIRICGFQ